LSVPGFAARAKGRPGGRPWAQRQVPTGARRASTPLAPSAS
jgi:hypothetical protein